MSFAGDSRKSFEADDLCGHVELRSRSKQSNVVKLPDEQCCRLSSRPQRQRNVKRPPHPRHSPSE